MKIKFCVHDTLCEALNVSVQIAVEKSPGSDCLICQLVKHFILLPKNHSSMLSSYISWYFVCNLFTIHINALKHLRDMKKNICFMNCFDCEQILLCIKLRLLFIAIGMGALQGKLFRLNVTKTIIISIKIDDLKMSKIHKE